jgi:hypothetical protein
MTEPEMPTPEPFHPLILELASGLGATPAPLTKPVVDELLARIGDLADEDLGHAIDSLERLAAFCHLELKAVDLAAQLVDVCYDTTPRLVLATEHLTAKKLDQAKARRAQFASLTGAKVSTRAPAVGDKPKQTVNALQPRTKFV